MTAAERATAVQLLNGSLRLSDGEKLDESEDWDTARCTFVIDDSTDVPPGLDAHTQPAPSAPHPRGRLARTTAAASRLLRRR